MWTDIDDSQLAEGGFSFVYLVEEILSLGSQAEPQQYALKKVSCHPLLTVISMIANSLYPYHPGQGSFQVRARSQKECLQKQYRSSAQSGLQIQVLTSTGEHVELAYTEIRVMQSLRHPNLLPLLASEHKEVEDEESGVSAFYMLFPLYSVQSSTLASNQRIET